MRMVALLASRLGFFLSGAVVTGAFFSVVAWYTFRSITPEQVTVTTSTSWTHDRGRASISDYEKANEAIADALMKRGDSGAVDVYFIPDRGGCKTIIIEREKRSGKGDREQLIEKFAPE